ncbi:MAG: hypothetical protein M0P95_07375 [Sulfuritalea sp.]|jgi:hypothetical protein|nr:hypothetical protein [Sulfuritalea sp.]
MQTRRHFLAALAVSVLTVTAGHALAAPPTMEILAMPHPPVKMALAPLREWLAAQGTKLKVVETDIESAQGAKRLAAVGLSGHVPIVILIDGSYRHRRKDGSSVEFVNFPAIKGSPPGALGNWTTADVQAALNERVK